MDKQYHHLSAEERVVIMIEHGNGASSRSIGLRLNRNGSTIAREIRRNLEDGKRSSYDATKAGMAYQKRRKRCGACAKIVEGSDLHALVREKIINDRWSPQQLSAKLREMNKTTPCETVSHETIYASIYAYPRGSLKKEMIAALRQAKPKRGCRRVSRAKGQTVPEQLRIIHRPEEVERRRVPGHWEGDLIKPLDLISNWPVARMETTPS